ncbi:ABC transporter, ATP-binding protein [Nostocoides japonicum T1-X7]|uniref:ABC transporter, ATP-binding protein n=1 Tax=Nostocoides japonicum T1-X7 TaxID=1194083 RepID=A0A077LTE1_9MICO|nr:ATP-binding cassette domain-containing protein [Tetrasphaera japonica]CCH76446.1 ABC transporter, ATP-binding protein [Tetrasphaera japonica T1-X7]
MACTDPAVAASGPVQGAARRRDGGLVEVSGLTWRPYGRRDPVLRDLTLTIPAGQRVLLVGPSGAGKSTLLRAVGGLLETADSGERTGAVTIDGMPAGSSAGMVGMVLQEPGAGIVSATVGRDVAFGLENVGADRTGMPRVVAESLRAVRLDKPADTPTSALSGGETQRLAIAGALALRPRVLLLDEPTAMLDPDNAASVRAVVDEVTRDRGLTVVVVEHRLGPWLDLVDRLLVLDRAGGIVADGCPGEVLQIHADSLAAQGIWVPGVPDPEPLRIPSGMFDQRSGEGTEPRGRVGGPAVRGEVGGAAVRGEFGGAELRGVRDVRVERVTRTIMGEERAVLAVDGVTASARAGRTTALVGPSGSGKSTLLLALAGLVDHTAGEAPATDVPSRELARQVAWVPQWSSSTIVARTVLDEALVSARAVGLADAVARPRALALLESLGLGDLLDADPRQLSGGEQRRLAMAAAVVHQPATLLADEPTVGQDRLTWAAVLGVVEAFREAGGAVVVSTHDDAVVARADDVVRLGAAAAAALPPASSPSSRLSGAARAASPTPPGRLPALPGPTRPRPSSPALSGPVDSSPDVPSVSALPPPPDPPAPAGPPSATTRRPLVSRCGPLALLGASLLGIPAGIVSPTWQASLLVVLAMVVIGGVGLWAPGSGAPPRGRLARVGVRMIPAAIGALSVGWSTWLLGHRDLEVAGTAGLRVVLIVLPAAFLLAYVDPDVLGDQLGQRLHLPARPVVALAAALQRVNSFGAVWGEISRARRVRGIGGTRSPRAVVGALSAMTMGLLVRALGEAAQLAVAMDARGFATAQRRTWYAAAPWRRADLLLVLAWLLPVAVAVVLASA